MADVKAGERTRTKIISKLERITKANKTTKINRISKLEGKVNLTKK